MIFGREPALIISFVAAVIGLVMAFGLDMTQQQVGAIMAVVIAACGVWIRSKVTPVEK